MASTPIKPVLHEGVLQLPGYSKPCRWCGELVPPDANACPVCGKKSPLEIRCPTCRSPIQESWKACPGCGLALLIPCPKCGKQTFVDVYCKECGADIMVPCPKCGAEQLPGAEKCVRCGKPMVKKKRW